VISALVEELDLSTWISAPNDCYAVAFYQFVKERLPEKEQLYRY
jgi:hypothetical protein